MGEGVGCVVDGCDRKHEARGFCSRHYQQHKKTPEFGATPCAVDDCEKPSLSRGWCNAHYIRWAKHGDPLGSTPGRRRAPCSVGDCGRPSEAHGLCKTHLSRWQRTGTTERRRSIAERFDEFVAFGKPDECWEWQGPRSPAGYGRAAEQYAHRVSCERAHGAPPTESSVAMHACDNPPCVNPAHLSWGTQSENMRDAWARTRRSA